MIIDKDENITIITQEKLSVTALVKAIESSYDKFKNHHIIVSLTSIKSISLQDIIEFLRVSNAHRSDNKSFVIITDEVNLDEMPDELVVVPTMQEAYDIIEMEDIERDLGI